MRCLTHRAGSVLGELLQKEDCAEFGALVPRLAAQLADRLGEALEPCFGLRAAALREAARALQVPSSDRGCAERDVEYWANFLDQLPVLKRLAENLVADWQRNTVELARRFRRDRAAIERRLLPSAPGRLIDVEINLSDPHRGGRRVAAMHFENGAVIYKPRNGGGESDWFRLLGWLNQLGFRPEQKVLKLIRRHNYLWVEYASAAPCQSENAAHRYFRRLGGMICLSHLLSAADCHFENVIAAGEYPVLVDAEILCRRSRRSKEGRDLRPEGILDTGWLCFNDYDVGALNTGKAGRHVPRIGIKKLRAADYLSDLQFGFADTWTLLTKKHRQAFARRLKRLQSHSWRHVIRPTGIYRSISIASVQPRAIVSEETRQRFLLDACSSAGMSANQIIREVEALSRLDIPVFRGRAAQRRVPPPEDLGKVFEVLSSTLNLLIGA